jgi:hypothetical protein
MWAWTTGGMSAMVVNSKFKAQQAGYRWEQGHQTLR